MKPEKSQSIRSFRTTRSVKSFVDLERDKPKDFDEMLTDACNKFRISRTIVKRDVRTDDFLQSIKPTGAFQLKRNVVKQQILLQSPSTDKTDESDHKSGPDMIEEDITVITAIYDNMNKLEEIMLQKHPNVPRKLIQIIGLLAPLFRELTKITLKRCNVNAYSLYELSKFLPRTTITEICLDDCHCPQANFVLLLNKPCHLVSLSLARCSINDKTCLEIASKLHFPESAEATLGSLNLSSNRITDVGAKGLGEALKTNRCLRYLNLSDNQIGDDGFDHILSALIDFELNDDETMRKRRRYMEYLRMKQVAFLKYYSELDAKSVDEASVLSKKTRRVTKAKKDPGSGRSSGMSGMDAEDILRVKAENMAREMVGPFRDPFTSYTTQSIDGVMHCLGNMVLCYLNFSYNNLTYTSVKKLNSVLIYQNTYKKLGQVGLLKVSIDGNNLPNANCCPEYFSIENMLMKNVIMYSPKYNAEGRRKSKGRISIPEKLLKK